MSVMPYRPINSEPVDSRLGRYIPDNFEHVEKYPYSAVSPRTVTTVDKVLKLPNWHLQHDQGYEGSCVGHGVAMERAITNTTQNVLLNTLGLKTRWYDPIDVWNQAKMIDEWPATNPGDDNGTSVHAAYDVCRTLGLSQVKKMELIDGIPTPVGGKPREVKEGVLTNRWATTVDEMRSALSAGLPVSIGINWYSAFDNPTAAKDGDYWIGKGRFGSIRGGHCVCIYGASDKRQAFRVKNSWGESYPLAWLPYAAMGRLLREDGEAALITDR